MRRGPGTGRTGAAFVAGAGVALALAALAACGGETARGLRFGPCPEFFLTECAEAKLPLDWSRPDGEQITVLVARRPAATPGASQLWLLEGGPGYSGGDFHDLVESLAAETGMSIYTLDHRGVGYSSRLGCDDDGEVARAEWPACLAAVTERWGDRTRSFTTTAAARDLGALIEATRAPGQPVFLYGLSYGAYWILRYLQLFPDQVSGVVLDSPVTPGAVYSHFDEQLDPVARELAARCAADAVCGAKLGADPWQFLTDLAAKIDQGHCPGLFADRAALRQTLGYLLLQRDGRIFALALAYRLDRCTAADRAAIAGILATFVEPSAETAQLYELFSPVLFTNIVLSELWEQPPPSLATLEARAGTALFSLDLALDTGSAGDIWPRYAPDEYAGAWPETSVPVLMLAGTLDPQTPIATASAAAAHLAGPHQTFVTVPDAPHWVFGSSPVRTPGAPDCGRQITLGFLAAPTAPPDTSCLADLAPLTFTYDAATTQRVMGTSDLWENP